MSFTRNPPDAPAAGLENQEARMREALGLKGTPNPRPSQERAPQQADPDRRRRKFVQDGAVPVVVLNPRREPAAESTGGNRLEAAEAALRTEREARDRAEKALQEAQATIQSLQTKLAHAGMAHAEALAAERRARETAQQSLADALSGQSATPDHATDAGSDGAPVGERETRSIRKQRGRRASTRDEGAGQPEPEPVKWWLPNFKTRRSKR